jgi:hypothetical protein
MLALVSLTSLSHSFLSCRKCWLSLGPFSHHTLSLLCTYSSWDSIAFPLQLFTACVFVRSQLKCDFLGKTLWRSLTGDSHCHYCIFIYLFLFISLFWCWGGRDNLSRKMVVSPTSVETVFTSVTFVTPASSDAPGIITAQWIFAKECKRIESALELPVMLNQFHSIWWGTPLGSSRKCFPVPK